MESIIIKKLAWCNPEAYIKASYQCIMQFKALRSYVPFESCAHPDVFCFYYSELGCFNYWWPDLNMDLADFISSIDCSALDGPHFHSVPFTAALLAPIWDITSLFHDAQGKSLYVCAGRGGLCPLWSLECMSASHWGHAVTRAAQDQAKLTRPLEALQQNCVPLVSCYAAFFLIRRAGLLPSACKLQL